jgi:hypothetical protein
MENVRLRLRHRSGDGTLNTELQVYLDSKVSPHVSQSLLRVLETSWYNVNSVFNTMA